MFLSASRKQRRTWEKRLWKIYWGSIRNISWALCIGDTVQWSKGLWAGWGKFIIAVDAWRRCGRGAKGSRTWITDKELSLSWMNWGEFIIAVDARRGSWRGSRTWVIEKELSLSWMNWLSARAGLMLRRMWIAGHSCEARNCGQGHWAHWISWTGAPLSFLSFLTWVSLKSQAAPSLPYLSVSVTLLLANMAKASC